MNKIKIICIISICLLNIISVHASEKVKIKHALHTFRPVSTYSIVAINKKQNQMGVAVQSHWFAVGSDVIWTESGVGVVATQALVEIAYGPNGLKLMKEGKSAKLALIECLKNDANRDVRQVAFIDANGSVASFTGKKCIPQAGNIMGENYSVQANLMKKDTVWHAMATAFENSSGELADRMLVALNAAQSEGGDIRGMQSAAIKVVRVKPNGPTWKNVLIDLRVDDNPTPLIELKRLLNLHRAYKIFYQGEDKLEKKHVQEAEKLFLKANRLLKNKNELLFWEAVDFFNANQAQKGLEYFFKLPKNESRWWILLQRLRTVGMMPSDNKLWNILNDKFMQK